MSNLDYAQSRLAAVQQRIAQACQEANRLPSEVTLIGASKKQTTELIANFMTAGLRDLGENYLQEGINKQSELAASLPETPINWHFIGAIQSNKTKLIATHFDWVHGVDRLKIARRLAEHGAQIRTQDRHQKRPLNLLIQLNPDAEQSKAGVALSAVADLADQITQLDAINLRGLMLIPKAREDLNQQRSVFAKARESLEQCNQRYGLEMDQLSMGMSGDLEAAILEGSTMVRIGTDLFGARST